MKIIIVIIAVVVDVVYWFDSVDSVQSRIVRRTV